MKRFVPLKPSEFEEMYDDYIAKKQKQELKMLENEQPSSKKKWIIPTVIIATTVTTVGLLGYLKTMRHE